MSEKISSKMSGNDIALAIIFVCFIIVSGFLTGYIVKSHNDTKVAMAQAGMSQYSNGANVFWKQNKCSE